MSLNVWLYLEIPDIDGNIQETEVFEANITHNLARMANEAGIYEALWHPNDEGEKKARSLVPILNEGLAKMKNDPELFKKLNSPNGWGTYDCFVPWIEEYLDACKNFPDAKVGVSR